MRFSCVCFALALGCSTPDGGATPVDPVDPVDAGTLIAPASFDCASIGANPSSSFYEDNPTYADPTTHAWATATPADVDIDESALELVAADLLSRPELLSFLVVRHGQLAFERYFHGAGVDDSNNVHSASKSILGAAIEHAVEQGHIPRLDTPLTDVLPGVPANKSAITIEHLLSMTSGLAWVEDVTEYDLEESSDWVDAILALPLAHTPGATFEYSTGNTHLLSAALTAATGTSTCAYVHERVLSPLGVVAEHWGSDPQGVFSGGYNLYLTPRELARFGQHALDDGPVDARTPHADAGDGYSYGYTWWLRSLAGHDVGIAWGWGGQLVYVVPDLDLVVVFTTNTRDYAPDFDGEAQLAATLLPAVAP